jgi:ADP-heptose:LPS heptosyltransferase
MKHQSKLFIDLYVGGLMHALLKIPTIVLGKILDRDHDVGQCPSLTVVKMLGGGSLVIAYPALLALRQSGRIRHLRLVTSPAVRSFGEVLGIFDEVIVIRDRSLWALALDSLAAIRKCFRCPAILDLEIHSRLSTVFTLFTCARNRIGFYTGVSFWRRNLSTHLLFYNVSNPIYDCYDRIAALWDAPVPDFRTCSGVFRSSLNLPEGRRSNPERLRLGVTPCCSELSNERMLLPEEWLEVLKRRLAAADPAQQVEAHLFGGPSDKQALDRLGVVFQSGLPRLTVINHAGKPLLDSIRTLDEMDEVFCIDSALLHFARLLGKPTVSFWGPTDPKVLLRPAAVPFESVRYIKLSCSPCVHLAERPPCEGQALCMRLAADPQHSTERNPAWVLTGSGVKRLGSRPG